MQVQNTTDAYQGFTVRTNPDEMVHGTDAHGNKISRKALPQLVTVRIPPLATVEIEDPIWEAALLIRAKRQGIQIVKDPITIGSDNKEKKSEHHIQTVVADGVYKSYHPVREMVKNGVLVVVKAPELKITMEEMRKAIESEQGFALPTDVDVEVLTAHYHKLFG